jgi:hypothetical protein
MTYDMLASKSFKFKWYESLSIQEEYWMLTNCSDGNSTHQVAECWEEVGFLDILRSVAVDNEEQRPHQRLKDEMCQEGDTILVCLVAGAQMFEIHGQHKRIYREA